MKKYILLFMIAAMSFPNAFSQIDRGSTGPGRSVNTKPNLLRNEGHEDFRNILSFRQVVNVPISNLQLKIIDKSVLKEAVELDKKKYLSYTYDLAKVDEYDTQSYVRYNIFDDQMEFVKDKSIYYLLKEEGRRVIFLESKITFRVYDFDNDLGFFKVYVDGKHSLVAKQKIRYVEAKVALSGYDRDRPADYKRLKDELYLAVNNKELIKLSKNKKEFYKAFGDKANKIKAYVKENKLKYKSMEDVSKIVEYYNTL